MGDLPKRVLADLRRLALLPQDGHLSENDHVFLLKLSRALTSRRVLRHALAPLAAEERHALVESLPPST